MDLTALPALAALGLLAYHLWRTVEGIAAVGPTPPPATGAQEARRDELLRSKRRLLEDLAEVDFDHAAGKLDAADRDALSRELKVRVVALMKEIDALDDVDTRGARIEAELARRLGRTAGA